MARTYTRTSASLKFEVGEGAPNAYEVLEGNRIPSDEPAKLALRLTPDVVKYPEVLGTQEEVDEYNKLKKEYPGRYAGRVVLNATAEPPELILDEVTSWCEPVTRDPETGALRDSELSQYWGGSHQLVTGTYTGKEGEILHIRN